MESGEASTATYQMSNLDIHMWCCFAAPEQKTLGGVEGQTWRGASQDKTCGQEKDETFLPPTQTSPLQMPLLVYTLFLVYKVRIENLNI